MNTFNMVNSIPERNNSEPSWYKNSEPVAECWFCNEDLFEGEYEVIEGYDVAYTCCGRDECIEAIALEVQ